MRLAVACSLLVGCASGRVALPPPNAVPALARADLADASGIWDWVYRSTDDQGDMRVEQEEWHLNQRGSRIEGYYDRAVTLMSVDERLFRCNQKLGFTKMTRVRISGSVEGDKVQLREVAFEAKPGPCDDGARNLVEYKGVLRGGVLALKWGPEAGQTLVRRVDEGRAPLVPPSTFGEGDTVVARSSDSVGAPVGGTWEWELRSIDADGDERVEREEWHLEETQDGVRGYYDRTVKHERGDGLFSCNGAARYATTTRYMVVGQRFGERLMLTEVDYKAEPSPCDNALRRLDSYQGHLADADSLILSWGPGNQLLRRRR